MLFHSIRGLLSLPDDTRLHLCHDHPPAGRAVTTNTDAATQRANNVSVHDGITEAEFVARRLASDSILALPALMLPAVQINIRAGRLPSPESNGTVYLKIPVDLF